MIRPCLSAVSACLSPVLVLGCGPADSGPSEPDAVATVSLSPASALVEPGQSLRLSATLRDARRLVVTGRDVVWASSDSLVALVAGGLVTGVREGFAVITASVDGNTGRASITVQRPVATVEIRPENPVVTIGTPVQLVATAVGGNGRTVEGQVVSWSTSDWTVARVDVGKVRGLRPGAAEITATVGDRSTTTTVTVVLNISGRWTLTTLTSDSARGLSCRTTGTLTITQTGVTFGGTLEQTGRCSSASDPVDLSGSSTLAEGALSPRQLDFLLDGQPRCVHVGALSGAPAQAAGDVSCEGDLGGDPVSLRGTWEMHR